MIEVRYIYPRYSDSISIPAFLRSRANNLDFSKTRYLNQVAACILAFLPAPLATHAPHRSISLTDGVGIYVPMYPEEETRSCYSCAFSNLCPPARLELRWTFDWLDLAQFSSLKSLLSCMILRRSHWLGLRAEFVGRRRVAWLEPRKTPSTFIIRFNALFESIGSMGIIDLHLHLYLWLSRLQKPPP